MAYRNYLRFSGKDTEGMKAEGIRNMLQEQEIRYVKPNKEIKALPIGKKRHGPPPVLIPNAVRLASKRRIF